MHDDKIFQDTRKYLIQYRSIKGGGGGARGIKSCRPLSRYRYFLLQQLFRQQTRKRN